MKLYIEDIEKISKEVSDGLQESCTTRWWKVLLQIGVMILLFVSYFAIVWYISLFTKEIIPYFIVIVIWFALLIWFVFLGYDYIEMRIYFWKKSKLKVNKKET